MGSQGYHGHGELSSYLEHDGIVGPTTAQAISAVTQLTSADSGSAISITPTSAYIIYLPTTAAGLHYRFVTIADSTDAVTITATGAHIFGVVVETPAASTGVQIDADTNIILGATSVEGLTVDLHGVDATHWYAVVTTTIDGSVTVS